MLIKVYKKYKTEVGEPTLIDLEPTGSVEGRFKHEGIEYEVLEYEDENEVKYLKRQVAISKEEYESNSSLYKGYYDTTPNSHTDSLEAVLRGDFNYHNVSNRLVNYSLKQDKIDNAIRSIRRTNTCPIIKKGVDFRFKYRESIRIGIKDDTHPTSYPKNIHKKYIKWRTDYPDYAEQLDSLIKSQI